MFLSSACTISLSRCALSQQVMMIMMRAKSDAMISVANVVKRAISVIGKRV